MRPAASPGLWLPFLTCALAVSLLAGPAAVEPSSGSVVQTSSDPGLETVLARASDYVIRYFGVMANLTADERYVQEISGVRTMAARVVGGQSRNLRSDIVLVHVGPPLEWRVYRDVFEVDGRPVRNRAERLARLFLEPHETARAQAEEIAEESARFNLSNMGRVLNEPGLPLVFLQPSLQPRFRFSLDQRERDDWILNYEERARPTLFWHNRTIANPSSGRFWIDAVTGAISRAEHTVSPSSFTATFVTEFRDHDGFGIAVPAEMREQLWSGVQAASRRVQGTATYSDYRRFAVTTHESPN
jgi:hypothetical protein